jgi:hypothetical protein
MLDRLSKPSTAPGELPLRRLFDLVKPSHEKCARSRLQD